MHQDQFNEYELPPPPLVSTPQLNHLDNLTLTDPQTLDSLLSYDSIPVISLASSLSAQTNAPSQSGIAIENIDWQPLPSPSLLKMESLGQPFHEHMVLNFTKRRSQDEHFPHQSDFNQDLFSMHNNRQPEIDFSEKATINSQQIEDFDFGTISTTLTPTNTYNHHPLSWNSSKNVDILQENAKKQSIEHHNHQSGERTKSQTNLFFFENQQKQQESTELRKESQQFQYQQAFEDPNKGISVIKANQDVVIEKTEQTREQSEQFVYQQPQSQFQQDSYPLFPELSIPNKFPANQFNLLIQNQPTQKESLFGFEQTNNLLVQQQNKQKQEILVANIEDQMKDYFKIDKIEDNRKQTDHEQEKIVYAENNQQFQPGIIFINNQSQIEMDQAEDEFGDFQSIKQTPHKIDISPSQNIQNEQKNKQVSFAPFEIIINPYKVPLDCDISSRQLQLQKFISGLPDFSSLLPAALASL